MADSPSPPAPERFSAIGKERDDLFQAVRALHARHGSLDMTLDAVAEHAEMDPGRVRELVDDISTLLAEVLFDVEQAAVPSRSATARSMAASRLATLEPSRRGASSQSAVSTRSASMVPPDEEDPRSSGASIRRGAARLHREIVRVHIAGRCDVGVSGGRIRVEDDWWSTA